MTFAELVWAYNWEAVRPVLMRFYPDQKSNLEGYKQVLAQLRTIEPAVSEMHIVVEWAEDRYADQRYAHVCGRKLNDDQNWALEFTDWAEWLGMEIAPLLLLPFTGIEVLAHCLYEMTFFGFIREDIAKADRMIAVPAGSDGD